MGDAVIVSGPLATRPRSTQVASIGGTPVQSGAFVVPDALCLAVFKSRYMLSSTIHDTSVLLRFPKIASCAQITDLLLFLRTLPQSRELRINKRCAGLQRKTTCGKVLKNEIAFSLCRATHTASETVRRFLCCPL